MTILEQLRTTNEQVQDTVATTIDAIEDFHQNIVRQPFALLGQIDAIAEPVSSVENFQKSIISGVYNVIRTATKTVGSVTTNVLNQLN